MELLNVLSARLRALFAREAVIGDIDEELRLHLEMETEANVARGMSPDEARRAALRSFGNFDSIRERGYEVRGGGLLETVAQDVRYGARILAKHKAFTAVAVLTLGLGIGANTAIFSLVDQMLVRPLPYRDADRLVLSWEVRPDGESLRGTSRANFLAWREQSKLFEGMAAFSDQRVSLTGGGEPEEVALQFASPELFRVLGVEPALGRLLGPEDARPSAQNVVVLSHELWRRRFGGDPRIIGRKVSLSGSPFTVAGVLPAGFEWHIRKGSGTGRPAEIWAVLPMPSGEGAVSHGRFLSVVARLKPGVSREQAEAELSAIEARLGEESPAHNKGMRIELSPLRDELVGEVRPALLVLLGAVGFVLLIACANVANLLLSRAAAREKEIVLRTAVGARRGRVIRQLLTESLLLSLLGCLLGLGLAWWGLEALVAISPRHVIPLKEAGLNLPVLGLTVAVSIVTGILFGLAPALLSTRLNLTDALKEGGRGAGGQGPRSGRLRSTLVIVEVALALVLLAGAGLLVQSFARMRQIPTGFDPKDVLTMVVRLPAPAPPYDQDSRIVTFFQQATDRVRRLPGVRQAGMVNFLPLYGGMGVSTSFAVEGRPAPVPGEEPGTNVRVADPGYFKVLGIPLLRGRSFNASEIREARRVVLISQSMARRHFPSENPLHQRIFVNMFDAPVPAEIIGVVGDVRYDSLVNEAEPTVYFPLPDLTYPFMTLVVRGGDAAKLAPAVRRVIREIDPNQPVSDVRTMEQVMADTVGRARFSTLLLGLFAGLATLLAAVGIFGVMSYSVTLRTREIGLRMALGARQGEVLRLVLKQGLGLTVTGIALGLAGAAALTRLLASLLYGVSATDPWTFAAIALLLAGVSWVACYLPARRAARVDPLIALRSE